MLFICACLFSELVTVGVMPWAEKAFCSLAMHNWFIGRGFICTEHTWAQNQVVEVLSIWSVLSLWIIYDQATLYDWLGRRFTLVSLVLKKKWEIFENSVNVNE